MNLRHLYILLLIVLFSTSCSTKKNTVLSRTYHNITSQYNVYFNGNESYKKGIKRMETGLKNDYSVLLPVFPFPNPESVSASSAEMDKTIKKSFKLITLHSITAKPEYSKGIRSASEKEFYNKKEYNKWIDDAYLMIGKASLMKNDLFMSNNAFRQIIKEYPGENTEIEAKIWLVRNLLLKEEYLEAGEMLEKLETEENMPRRLKSFYRATYADFYLHKKKIPEAIEQLELAVKARNDKKTLLRYTFLLGQLYQRTGNFNNASEKYLKVIKMSPPYEMAFNAQINMAGTYDANNRNAAEIRKRLNKLLKDSKNKEFQDQIYYALANINIKENEVDEAIKNYKLSIRKSVSNAKQKARSYFAIAEIKYENKNYLLAQAYYDSTVVNIDETFPDYQRISLRSRNLKRLVDNLNMVSFEDSVQFIAKMSESERNTFIDNIIAKLKEKEAEDQRVKQEEMLEMQNNVNLLNDLNNNSSQTADGNKWYFYNPSARGLGETDFQLKWGKRKLEDNWRRSSKKFSSSNETTSETEVAETSEKDKKKGLSNKSREYYTVNIPINDSMLTASNNKIKKGLTNSGKIYKDELLEYKLSARQYEDLIRRFPDDPNVPDAAYQLYIVLKQLNNIPKAEEYKSLLLTKYPESIYSKMLTNPNFAAEMQEKENVVSRIYESAYNFYNLGNYNASIEQAQQGIKNYPSHKLLPKFHFIRALAIGKLTTVDSLRKELNILIKVFPKSEEASSARDIIAMMDVKHPEVKEAEEKVIASEIYKPAPNDEKHYFVFVLNPKQGNQNQLVFNLINYNLDNYTNANLSSKAELVGANQMIVVRDFKSKTEALNYYDVVSKDAVVLKDAGKIISSFVISITNFELLKKDGVDSRYTKFFNENYKH